MTAVMRAMSVQTGPKVLRIGLVQSGRVIEERIIKQRTTVTVGSNERAVFVIPSQAVPPMFKLFELIGNDYHLNFVDGMTGRVALASGITDLAALKGQLEAAVTRNDAELANHEFTILTVLRQRSEQLVAEANQCIGEEAAFIGDTRTSVQIDPQIPPDETPYPVTDPVVVIGPPQCSSCTL
jgi:hypothetical protein